MKAQDFMSSVDFTPEQLQVATCLNYISSCPWNPGLSETEVIPEKANTLIILLWPKEGRHLPRVTQLVAEPGLEPKSLVPDISVFCFSSWSRLSSQAFFSETNIHGVNRDINSWTLLTVRSSSTLPSSRKSA